MKNTLLIFSIFIFFRTGAQCNKNIECVQRLLKEKKGGWEYIEAKPLNCDSVQTAKFYFLYNDSELEIKQKVGNDYQIINFYRTKYKVIKLVEKNEYGIIIDAFGANIEDVVRRALKRHELGDIQFDILYANDTRILTLRAFISDRNAYINKFK